MSGRIRAADIQLHCACGHQHRKFLTLKTFGRLLWILSDGYKLKIVHTRKLLKMQINEWHIGNSEQECTADEKRK